jgi:hypothetical protein
MMTVKAKLLIILIIQLNAFYSVNIKKRRKCKGCLKSSGREFKDEN